MSFHQDLPPAGGYPRIPYLRNLPKRGPSGAVIWLGVIGVTTFGLINNYFARKHLNAEIDENNFKHKLLYEEQYPLMAARDDLWMLKMVKELETEVYKAKRGHH